MKVSGRVIAKFMIDTRKLIVDLYTFLANQEQRIEDLERRLKERECAD